MLQMALSLSVEELGIHQLRCARAWDAPEWLQEEAIEVRGS